MTRAEIMKRKSERIVARARLAAGLPLLIIAMTGTAHAGEVAAGTSDDASLDLAMAAYVEEAKGSAQTAEEAMSVAAVYAAEASATAVQDPPEATVERTKSGWQFSTVGYLWMSGMKGDLGVGPNVPPAHIDLSFTDALKNLKLSFMGMAMVQKGRFVAIGDITWVKLGTSAHVGVRDPNFLEVDLESRSFTGTLAAGYRIVDQGPLSLDLMAGIRLSAMTTKLKLEGPVRSVEGKSSETWVDPIVAARLRAPLARRWNLGLYGDVGGFGVSSDVTWQLIGTVQYDLGKSTTIAAGWRHHEIDYHHDGFLNDTAMTGPIIGVVTRF
jgi:hypothetical protein